MQPARVQHHRLHIRPRGTDVSAGPLCLVGDTGWPRASSAVRGRWERRACSHSWRTPGLPHLCSPRGFAATTNPAYGDTCWVLGFDRTGLASIGWLLFDFGGSWGKSFRCPSLPAPAQHDVGGLCPGSACPTPAAQQRGSCTLSSPFLSNKPTFKPERAANVRTAKNEAFHNTCSFSKFLKPAHFSVSASDHHSDPGRIWGQKLIPQPHRW